MNTLDGRVFQAVSNGDLEAARQVLDQGALVNALTIAKDDYASVPLFTAVWAGRADLVALLLAHGASIHGRNESGWTLLHCAVHSDGARVGSSREVFETLLEAGAVAGWSRVCSTGYLDDGPKWSKRRVIELLLQAGAEPDARDVVGKRPIDYVNDREPVIREMLLNHAAAAALDAHLPAAAPTRTRGRL